MSRIATAVLVATLACCIAGCDGPRPNDAELSARLKAYRPQIDELMRMIRSDRVLTRVDDNWTEPADLDAYRLPLEQTYFQTYKHLEGPWYLELDAG